MTKCTLTVFALTGISAALTIAGLFSPLVPQSLFAFGLSVLLWNIVTQSNRRSV